MSSGLVNRGGRLWLAAVFAAAILAVCAPAWAAADAASPWFVTDQGRVRLIAASPSLDGGRTIRLGLEFRLAPHWKIYWRSPGDAGYPPRLDWSNSENLADTRMAWPAPQRFSVLGLETVGYTGAVVFPITARVERPGEPLRLRLALDYLTCSDICIPYQTKLAIDLPPGPTPAGASGYAALIAQYAARVPADGSGSGLAFAGATLVPGSAPALEIRVHSKAPLAAPDAFVEAPAGVGFGAPRLIPGETADEAVLHLPMTGDEVALDGLVGRRLAVTLVDGQRSIEGVVVPGMGPPAVDPGQLLWVLALALLGGFILNFMPCVLPVLSIKLLSAIEHGGQSRQAVRLGFLATAAGVLASFAALALAMIALKEAGVAVGWGVQFQQPLFLVGMAALLTFFACNLWGFFEVPLPAPLAGLAARGHGRAMLGNFAAGIFATLLATPCSAPFLGTAVGFALASGPPEILVIFLALGIGLAVPYLLVAAAPRVAFLLPRPGRWMVGVRRALGVALALTVAWLVSVLAVETGLAAALSVAALLAVLAAALALLRRAAPRRAVVAGALLAAFLVPAATPAPAGGNVTDAFWQPFDQTAIDGLVHQGRTVFVDVTAQWCLTCRVNERLVLDSDAVRQRLARPGVVAMRADWTRPSAAIAAYLRRYGRYGIPFNAVYGPGAPNGLPLPEILTVDEVTSALAEAAAPARLGSTAH
jgi:suppressor for copper-sensitivity B